MALRRRAHFALATNRPFERLVLGTPALRERARRSAARYVAGERLEDALAVAAQLRAVGLDASLDLFGEREGDRAAIEQALAGYERLARAIEPGTWVSVDLSHVGLELGVAEATSALRAIAAAMPRHAKLQVGAEEAAVADDVLAAVLAAAADGVPVTATVQANLRRSPADAQRLAGAGVPIRLVKGAYVEPPAVAHPYGPPTDAAFRRIAEGLLGQGAAVSLGTHDPALHAAFPQADVELLLGVRPDDAVALAAAGRRVRVYAPYGDGWLRYLLRRRAEAQGAA
ncbi:MAG TPA: proline dehydrogenase family protein [Capillimicrobium sp.]|jgi:proline dehydrogenase